MRSMVPVTGWRGSYFRLLTTGVSKVATLSYGRNHRHTYRPEPIKGQLPLTLNVQVRSRHAHRLVILETCRAMLLQVCGSNSSWFIRLVVWRQVSFLLWNCSFLHMCNVNYSVFLLRISFYIYAWPSGVPRNFDRGGFNRFS